MVIQRKPLRFHVLVVEDNPADADLLKMLFEPCNVPLEIHVATDGNEATDFVRRTGKFSEAPRPHLILMDLNVPQKGGRELLTELKADPDLRKIPIVVLTTSNSVRDVEDAYSLHANAFLSKPLDLDEFSRSVTTLVDFWFRCAEVPS